MELLAHRNPAVLPFIVRDANAQASAVGTLANLGTGALANGAVPSEDSLSARAVSLLVCLCGLIPGSLGLISRVESRTIQESLEEERLHDLYVSSILEAYRVTFWARQYPQESDVVGISAVEPCSLQVMHLFCFLLI